MQGSKQGKAQSKKSTEELKAERQSDATDDEVLREAESGGGAEAKSDGLTPSPDGAFDEDGEQEKAEPM